MKMNDFSFVLSLTGSMFARRYITVSLPHRIADESVFLAEASKEVRSDEFSGKRILLAEDNDRMRRLRRSC